MDSNQYHRNFYQTPNYGNKIAKELLNSGICSDGYPGLQKATHNLLTCTHDTSVVSGLIISGNIAGGNTLNITVSEGLAFIDQDFVKIPATGFSWYSITPNQITSVVLDKDDGVTFQRPMTYSGYSGVMLGYYNEATTTVQNIREEDTTINNIPVHQLNQPLSSYYRLYIGVPPDNVSIEEDNGYLRVNDSGIISTIFSGTTGNIITLNSTTGNITTTLGTTINYATGTVTNLTSTTAGITTLNNTTGNITTASGTTINYDTGTIGKFNCTSGNVVGINGTNLNYATGTVTNFTSTTAGITNGNITIASGTTATFQTGIFNERVEMTDGPILNPLYITTASTNAGFMIQNKTTSENHRTIYITSATEWAAMFTANAYNGYDGDILILCGTWTESGASIATIGKSITIHGNESITIRISEISANNVSIYDVKITDHPSYYLTISGSYCKFTNVHFWIMPTTYSVRITGSYNLFESCNFELLPGDLTSTSVVTLLSMEGNVNKINNSLITMSNSYHFDVNNTCYGIYISGTNNTLSNNYIYLFPDHLHAGESGGGQGIYIVATRTILNGNSIYVYTNVGGSSRWVVGIRVYTGSTYTTIVNNSNYIGGTSGAYLNSGTDTVNANNNPAIT